MIKPRSRNQARGLWLLGICLLILSAMPARHAQAALIAQGVDNSLADFTLGTFQRTSLSALQVTSPPPGPQPKSQDEIGAVQLVPIGVLKDWFNSPFQLPKDLTDHGAVAIGRNIFVIGGTTLSEQTAEVWSAKVDPTTGALLGDQWFDEQDLPAIQVSDQVPTPVAARAVPAVTAVATGTDSGYIYVIGGSTQPSGAPGDISSYAVSIATVENGHITRWAEGPKIPEADVLLGQLGVQSAAAFSFTTGGKTFVYLLGGLQRYAEGTTIVSVPSPKVFYAQVGAGGQLVKPSSPNTQGWDALADIPVSDPATMGVWDGTAVANHFDVGGGVGGDALYLIGGQLRPQESGALYNNAVFRALINSDGTLSWTSASGSNQWEGTLPEGRIALAGVEFNGSLYVTGGRPISGNAPAQPQAAVMTTYVEDDLKLSQLGDNGSNFLRNATALSKPRARHASVVVPATPTPEAPNAAYVYVIGGQGDGNDQDPSDDLGSKTVIYGKVGESEDTAQTGYALSGWYYSAAHDMIFTGAEVREINWTTVINRTGGEMDIEMQYRISTASDCNSPNAFNGTGTEWRTVDGAPDDAAHFSLNSANSVNLGSGLVAHCFQYRARLTTSGSPATTSPALLNVSIVINVPGGPDLTVSQLKERLSVDGRRLTGLTVSIQNVNTKEQTLPADVEGGGSFFVDLFVFGPGETATTPTLPLTPDNSQGSKGYANIDKKAMGANATLHITQWCRPDGTGCQPLDILSLFPTYGTYTVIVAVDSFDFVRETTAGAEDNNLAQITFELTPPDNIPGCPPDCPPPTGVDTYLPIINRQ